MKLGRLYTKIISDRQVTEDIVDTGSLQQHEQVSVPLSYVGSADKVAVVAVPAILISLAFWLITHLHIYVQLLHSSTVPGPWHSSSTFTIIHSPITSEAVTCAAKMRTVTLELERLLGRQKLILEVSNCKDHI